MNREWVETNRERRERQTERGGRDKHRGKERQTKRRGRD